MDVEAADRSEVARERDFERFLTFVDAVVAIAITLLVLPLVDLAGQLEDGGSVTHLLREHQADLWGFLLSFAVIANLWFTQHHIVRHVVVQDPRLTWLMMGWLLMIVVLPFPTALVAHSGHQPATKVLYIGTMALSSLFLAAMSSQVARHPEIRDSEEVPDTASSVGTLVVFVVSLVLTLVVPAVGYWPLVALRAVDRVLGLGRFLRDRSR